MQNALRLKRLCEDILDVARIENNGMALEKTLFSFPELVQETIDHSKPLIREGIEIVFFGQSLSVTADRDKLQQVVQNLLHNAIKFTHQGVIQVSLSANSDEEVVFTVRDNGVGIDPEILPRLFSKYASKSEKGTGLGLFISKNIVEAHYGRIWAENNPGNGATFAFSLPLNQTRFEKTPLAA
jgi:signal transduction histidine kinase